MITEMETKQFNGAVESPRDNRQIHYEDLVFGALPPDMPRKYNVEEKYGKVARTDQGSSLACVSMGGSRYKEVKDLKETKKFVQVSPRFIYSQYHLANGGMYVRDVMRCLQDNGVAEESIFSTLRASQPITENWMRYKGDLTEDVKKNAEIHKIKSYADIYTKNPELIARAIWENDGVILGIRGINASMGHLIFWAGYDLDAKTFDILDSYPEFSKQIVYNNGKFYFCGGEIALFDIFTAVDLPNSVIESCKDMYLLRRSPYDFKEVYALNEEVRRHISNKQTLIEGAKDLDKYWIWQEGDNIPMATDDEWARHQEVAEIILIPPDASFGQKFGANIKIFFSWIKRLFGIK